MADFQVPANNDVSALKKIEKKIIQDGKKEDKDVSHTLKDLAKLEKASHKADKAFDKSQHALEKTHRKQHSAAQSLNKATYKHEQAIAATGNAEKDVDERKREAERLRAEVEKRKSEVNGVLEGQKQHNSLRESKLAEIHHARASTGSPRASIGTTSIATNGSAPTGPATNLTGTEAVASPVEG